MIQHSTELVEGFKPKRLCLCRIPGSLRVEMDHQGKEMHQAGMIIPSNSQFTNPIVCVMKKEKKIRLCIDYKFFNSGTIRDMYPMQNVDLDSWQS